MSAKEYVEISFYNSPDRNHNREITTIGLNGEYRFLKKSYFMPYFGFDEFYVKGVGLYESKIDKAKTDEYSLYRNLIYSLSKKEFNKNEGFKKIVMVYINDGKEYKYKVNISNASRSDTQANKLNDWFKSEYKSMVFDQSMIFKAGVLMRNKINFRGDKVYINLFIDNPTKQNVEMNGFKNLSLDTKLKFILVKILDKNNRFIKLNLDGKYLINNQDETLKINSGKGIELEFIYDIEDFYKTINNKENVDILKEMLLSEEKLRMYTVVRNRFIYPKSISGSFEYNTFIEEIDISPLKRFN